MHATPADPVTRLCLIRHGETAWNAERRIQGQRDIPLNDEGMRQARAAGQWLRTAGLTALYSSDLQRAWTTAAHIGQAIGLTPRPAAGLRERHYGIFQGLTYDEARQRHPAAYARLERRAPDDALESGESLHAFFQRVRLALTDIADAHPGGVVAAVAHGGVLDMANRLVRGNALEAKRDFLIPNAGLNWLVRQGGGWRIESWAETPHLQPGVLDELPA